MILGYEEGKWSELGGAYTAREIVQQPKLWIDTYQLVKSREEEIKKFISEKVSGETRILFTGAGTSDYVGRVIQNHINGLIPGKTEVVATTDIVSNPQDFIEPGRKTLLVSFARSGNSPESIGAFQLFQKKVENISHLVITCNREGDLAKMAQESADNFVLVLPDETNDKGFAMTSSFSCMLLAALLIFDISQIDDNQRTVEIIADQGRNILENKWEDIKSLLGEDVKRIIYLGAGCFKGLTKELALKNLELTNGDIATMQESVLGFRHGPKTFMDNQTLIFVLTSLNDHTNLYIRDLIKEIHHDKGQHKLAVISYQNMDDLKPECDSYISFESKTVPEAYAALNYVLFGQMVGLFNSIRLGMRPDNPCPDGTVNRVVKGVILHQI